MTILRPGDARRSPDSFREPLLTVAHVPGALPSGNNVVTSFSRGALRDLYADMHTLYVVRDAIINRSSEGRE